ncbi:hypothetical protein N7G274_009627 [Stereocaulon virgatum]|uniref:COP9 signalosome complex subunit 4 n=1 Tax=Stereocaulon virgatum TaxID=373712 RepID=A0ABR4A037_9LECA
MASRLARSAVGAARLRPALPLRTLPALSTSLTSHRYASNIPTEEPAKKAQAIIDALPGSSLISKTAILSAGASLSVFAISNEFYVVNEETIIMFATLSVFWAVFHYGGPMYSQWAEGQINKMRGILNAAREDHTNAVKARIDNVKELGGVINVTKQLFEVSKETARLEAQAFELEQKTALAAEAKSVLDSWVRYEGQVKARQQKELAHSIISKITKELENPKTLQQILNQSVADVEKIVSSKAQQSTSTLLQHTTISNPNTALLQLPLNESHSSQRDVKSSSHHPRFGKPHHGSLAGISRYNHCPLRSRKLPNLGPPHRLPRPSLPNNFLPHPATNLTAFIDSILSPDSIGIVSARPLLASAVEAISALQDPEAKIQVGTHALETLQPRVVSFEEQDAAIREIIADAYTAQDDFIEAAKILSGIQLESSQRKISDDAKVRIWMRICRLYLEDDDTTSAESYLNRAKNLLYKVDDPELNLTFQLSQARILDARRRFLDASSVFHSVSFAPTIAEEERLHCLSAAFTCAVLAPAGPQRSRALAKLYKDERAGQVAEFGIVEKMFLDRLLSKAEVEKFKEGLKPHQLAKTADGSTVLAKAVVEHNLLSASRLYNNIGVNELGLLLDLDAEKAEQYAATMLEQGRLAGHIDQIDGVIFFDGVEGNGERVEVGGRGRGRGDKVVGREVRKWDEKVKGIAEEVERVASLLQSLYPEFVVAA